MSLIISTKAHILLIVPSILKETEGTIGRQNSTYIFVVLEENVQIFHKIEPQTKKVECTLSCASLVWSHC